MNRVEQRSTPEVVVEVGDGFRGCATSWSGSTGTGTTGEAIERLRLTGLPLLFYRDGEHRRATVLYHRDDGNYGLVDPARTPN